MNAAFHPRDGQLAAFERCLRSGAVPRFRLVSLDPASGRWLLYAVGSHDPMDSQEPRPETGTWWHGDGRRVRVHDDQRIGSGDASQLITSTFPSW